MKTTTKTVQYFGVISDHPGAYTFHLWNVFGPRGTGNKWFVVSERGTVVEYSSGKAALAGYCGGSVRRLSCQVTTIRG